MALEQYIVRELRQDIKLLINKVTELEQKLEEAHPTQKSYTLSHDASGDVYTESKKMQDELEPINDTFKRYEEYTEWDKTHNNYKILYAPDGQDEHGKKIDD